jgi:hypothetical protein
MYVAGKHLKQNHNQIRMPFCDDFGIKLCEQMLLTAEDCNFTHKPDNISLQLSDSETAACIRRADGRAGMPLTRSALCSLCKAL